MQALQLYSIFFYAVQGLPWFDNFKMLQIQVLQIIPPYISFTKIKIVKGGQT